MQTFGRCPCALTGAFLLLLLATSQARAGEPVVDSPASAAPSAPSSTPFPVPPASPPAQEPAQATAAPPAPPKNTRALGFLSRFVDGYVADYAYVPGPAPARRGFPDAMDSPPFPSNRWSLNGTPDIGVPDTTIYPLMGALYGGPGGKAIERTRIKAYGWVDGAMNVSTSTSYRGNYPAAYQINPNTVSLQQGVIRLERIPDTVQRDHVDFGFRTGALYGIDYRYTTMSGIFSNQIRNNKLYGFDVNELYLDTYIPWVGMGLDVRVGRFISIPDIEADLSVDRPFSSLSYAYTYDPFSQMGALGSVKLSPNWWVQAGIVAGDDVAIWAKGARPTFVGCVRWESDDQRDSLYPCINSLNDGKYFSFTDGPTPASSPIAYPGNNLQAPVVVWGHRFAPDWTMQSEGWFMWMRDAPEYTAGAPTGRIISFNYEWALLNFQYWQFSSNDFLGWRNEMMDDHYGQRTGFKTRLWETTLSWNHWMANKLVGLRPEVRFDTALDDETPFDGGKKKGQLWAQFDTVVRF